MKDDRSEIVVAVERSIVQYFCTLWGDAFSLPMPWSMLSSPFEVVHSPTPCTVGHVCWHRWISFVSIRIHTPLLRRRIFVDIIVLFFFMDSPWFRVWSFRWGVCPVRHSLIDWISWCWLGSWLMRPRLVGRSWLVSICGIMLRRSPCPCCSILCFTRGRTLVDNLRSYAKDLSEWSSRLLIQLSNYAKNELMVELLPSFGDGVREMDLRDRSAGAPDRGTLTVDFTKKTKFEKCTNDSNHRNFSSVNLSSCPLKTTSSDSYVLTIQDR